MADFEMQTVVPPPQNAIYVRGAYAHYGTVIKSVVLENLNMTVPKGIIYGLLGTSGCGKTTLLNCIVGRKTLDSGKLCVLGRKNITGPLVGYMPQQVALYGDFSIIEIMKYFGWLAGMTTYHIEERLRFLTVLLELPDSKRLIKNLSGGEQRRISFATTLLHEPELLILDEPTVGLDSILRETIWAYMLNVTREGKATIILTTHYIDEAKQAHQVGFMHNGRILAEASPCEFLRRFTVCSLEEVFYKLSTSQATQNCITNDENDIDRALEKHSTVPIMTVDYISNRTSSNNYCLKLSHLKSLMWKNYTWMLRNWIMITLLLLLPALIVSLFHISFGNNLKDLKVAVTNYEMNHTTCQIITCDSGELSCNYLKLLEERHLNLIYYDSEIEGRNTVLHGEIFASIVIKHNFSEAFKSRIANVEKANDWDITYSTIDVFRDVAIKDVAQFLKKYLYETFNEFVGNYLESCNVTRRALSIPIQWNTPVYGVINPSYHEFVTPAFLLTLGFLIACAVTCAIMLPERMDGLLDRTLVMDVSLFEIVISHMICEFIVITIQTILMLFVSFVLFKMMLKGSLILLTFFLLLNGFCGMCVGLAVGCVCKSLTTSAYIVTGNFLPIISLSGTFWPVEGMHCVLRPIGSLIYFTQVIVSLRDITQKGWGLEEPSVYLGLIYLICWIAFFLVIIMLILKIVKV